MTSKEETVKNKEIALCVIQSFAEYKKGDLIKDFIKIEEILKEYTAFVVKVKI